MKIKKITVQLDDGTVDHAFDHGVEAGYDLGTHVSDNFDFLLNSIGYRKQSEGEWLPYPNDSFMKCSICGMEYPKARMPHTVGYCPNPNCGAKMGGGAK